MPGARPRAGKSAGIHEHIGRRPIMALGNSDGDLQMLQYTGAGAGPRFCLYVHHDDAEREYACDRGDALAAFDKGWDEALSKGWTVVSLVGGVVARLSAPPDQPARDEQG